MKPIYYLVIAALAIIAVVTLIIMDKLSWETGIAFLVPALIALNSEARVERRDQVIINNTGQTYQQLSQPDQPISKARKK